MLVHAYTLDVISEITRKPKLKISRHVSSMYASLSPMEIVSRPYSPVVLRILHPQQCCLHSYDCTAKNAGCLGVRQLVVSKETSIVDLLDDGVYTPRGYTIIFSICSWVLDRRRVELMMYLYAIWQRKIVKHCQYILVVILPQYLSLCNWHPRKTKPLMFLSQICIPEIELKNLKILSSSLPDDIVTLEAKPIAAKLSTRFLCWLPNFLWSLLSIFPN
jgi:hypothetical protein